MAQTISCSCTVAVGLLLKCCTHFNHDYSVVTAGLGMLASHFRACAQLQKSSVLSNKSLRGHSTCALDFPRYYPCTVDSVLSTSISLALGFHRYKPNFWKEITLYAPQCLSLGAKLRRRCG